MYRKETVNIFEIYYNSLIYLQPITHHDLIYRISIIHYLIYNVKYFGIQLLSISSPQLYATPLAVPRKC